MPADSTFWRKLRREFKSLQSFNFKLIWNSKGSLAILTREQSERHWTWFRTPDPGLTVRLEAIALRGARALGYESQDDWFDELRKSEFVEFEITGRVSGTRSDGVRVDAETGAIEDVVEHSITLCHKLEAEAGLANVATTRVGLKDSHGRKGYRAEVRRWMKSTGMETLSQAAKRLGVGKDTLKTIMSCKGKLRCAESTQTATLTKMGIKTS